MTVHSDIVREDESRPRFALSGATRAAGGKRNEAIGAAATAPSRARRRPASPAPAGPAGVSGQDPTPAARERQRDHAGDSISSCPGRFPLDEHACAVTGEAKGPQDVRTRADEGDRAVGSGNSNRGRLAFGDVRAEQTPAVARPRHRNRTKGLLPNPGQLARTPTFSRQGPDLMGWPTRRAADGKDVEPHEGYGAWAPNGVGASPAGSQAAPLAATSCDCVEVGPAAQEFTRPRPCVDHALPGRREAPARKGAAVQHDDVAARYADAQELRPAQSDDPFGVGRPRRTLFRGPEARASSKQAAPLSVRSDQVEVRAPVGATARPAAAAVDHPPSIGRERRRGPPCETPRTAPVSAREPDVLDPHGSGPAEGDLGRHRSRHGTR
jgi:hypothetical protein